MTLQQAGEADTQVEHDDTWELAGRTFRSRLLVGSGKFASIAQTRAAIEASGAEIVTVAVRRVSLGGGPSCARRGQFCRSA